MSQNNNREENNYLGIGIAIGLPLGGGGIVLGIVLDNMAFMGIGLGTELAIGVSIGTALNKRNQQ